MAKRTVKEEPPIIRTQIFEDEETISTWRFDSSKNKFGPYMVDIKYKKPYKPDTVKRTKVKLGKK